MRNLASWAILVFVAALAYVIGVRLDETAMAVVIGVIFGILASVPASLFLLWHVTRTQCAWTRPDHARVVYVVEAHGPETGGGERIVVPAKKEVGE